MIYNNPSAAAESLVLQSFAGPLGQQLPSGCTCGPAKDILAAFGRT